MEIEIRGIKQVVSREEGIREFRRWLQYREVFSPTFNTLTVFASYSWSNYTDEDLEYIWENLFKNSVERH